VVLAVTALTARWRQKNQRMANLALYVYIDCGLLSSPLEF
jgi:hypothetical protein